MDIYNSPDIINWSSGVSLLNNNHHSVYSFDIPTNASATTYVFYIGAQLASGSKFIRELNIIVLNHPAIITF